jgi:hypothetical protein
VWLNEREEGLLPTLLAFEIKDVDVFPKNMFGDMVVEKMGHGKRIMKTKIMNENNNSDPKDGVLRFCTLMIKLHSCCATPAGIERFFFLYLVLFGLNCGKSPKKVVKMV